MSACLTDLARVSKPATVHRHTRNLAVWVRFLEETGRPLTWDQLSRQMLVEFYAWASLKENGLHGKARKAITVKRLVETVEQAWRWWSEHDDFSALAGPTKTLAMKAPPSRKTMAPTWEEMAACIEACTGWHKHLATLLYGLGLRSSSQAMQLTWADVDMERATITVRPELGKTDSEATGRVIPIAPWLVDVLAGWGTRDGFLVKRPFRGDRLRAARSVEMANAWEWAGVRVEVWQGQPHHAFRKGFVSGLKRAGADDEAVEYLVGHSLGLRGVYTDADALPLREAVALIPAPVKPKTLKLKKRGTR